MDKKAKIYVIFGSSGLDHRGAWSGSDIKKKVMTNEDILKKLEKRCEETEFIGRVNLIDEERKDKISRTRYGMTKEERPYRAETQRISGERTRVEPACR